MEKVTKEYLENLIDKETYIYPENSTVTICMLTLKNGFNLIGHSACLNKEDFNPEIGNVIAKENAINKLWELEGYHRKCLA